MNNSSEEIIIYSTADGKANISLLAKDGSVWLNQNQLAELFATSKANISTHISNVFEDKELQENSVVKFYLTTATDGKDYNVAFYSLEMILAIGFRVRSKRGVQFRQWANRNLVEFIRYEVFNQKRKVEAAKQADLDDKRSLRPEDVENLHRVGVKGG